MVTLILGLATRESTRRRDVMTTEVALTKTASGSFLLRNSSFRETFEVDVPKSICATIVVLGASGDLAKKKTYPALFQLHVKGSPILRCWDGD